MLNNNNQVATTDVNDVLTLTGWKIIGPACGYFVGGLLSNIEAVSGRQFNQFNLPASNVANNSAGFLGNFGCYNNSSTNGAGGDQNWSRGIRLESNGRTSRSTTSSDSTSTTNFSFFRKAGLGEIPDMVTYTDPLAFGQVGQNSTINSNVGLFTDINIKLRGYAKGCDVTTGRIIIDDVIF